MYRLPNKAATSARHLLKLAKPSICQTDIGEEYCKGVWRPEEAFLANSGPWFSDLNHLFLSMLLDQGPRKGELGRSSFKDKRDEAVSEGSQADRKSVV